MGYGGGGGEGRTGKDEEQASVSVICEGRTEDDRGGKWREFSDDESYDGCSGVPSLDAKNTSEEFKAGGNSRAENSIIVA